MTAPADRLRAASAEIIEAIPDPSLGRFADAAMVEAVGFHDVEVARAVANWLREAAGYIGRDTRMDRSGLALADLILGADQ